MVASSKFAKSGADEPSPGSKLVVKTKLHVRLVKTIEKRIEATKESFWDPVNAERKTSIAAVRNNFQRCQKAVEKKVQRWERWEQRAALNLLRTLGLYFEMWPKSSGQSSGRVNWRVAEMVVAAMLTQQTNDTTSLVA